jgi:hypothetical protein
MRFKSLLSVALAAGLAGFAPAVFAQSSASGSSTSQVPQTDPSGVNWEGVGIGAGTVAGNIVYIPAKLVYGILGGISGGAGYSLTGGNEQVANTIWRSSLGGDYVLTPDMVSGKQPIHFSGPTQTAQPGPDALNAPSSSNAIANTTSPPLTSTPPAATTSSSTHPIDSGAGPLGAGTTLNSEPIGTRSDASAGASYGRTGAATKSAPASSSTSIE